METTQDVQLPKKRFDQALAYTLKNDVQGVKDMLAKNGYDASKLNSNGVHIAFLKAIKDSSTFRADVAKHLTGVVDQLKAHYAKYKPGAKTPALNFVNQPQVNFVSQPMNFVNQPNGLGFVREPGALNMSGVKTHLNLMDDYSTDANLSATLPTTAAINTTTTTPAPASSGSFWDSLGSLANKDNLNKLFNTGLDTLSTSLKNSSNSTTEQNALELERLRLQQIQAQNENTGMGTGTIIVICVLSAAVIGGGLYLILKKKKV